jgi:hypothetical protein
MRVSGVILGAVMAALMSWPVFAADEEATGASPPQKQLLSEAELDQLVAPIALYPDALLAQVLMASTYPLEVVQADRFAKANASLKDDKLDAALAKEDWDDSVKSLVATPTVLAMMNDDLDWTQKLGDAVLAQQADVMDAVQRLRVRAEDNGKLATTKEQTVTVTKEADKEVIVIEPASPETVYVPYYEPAVVYGAWPYPDYPPYYFPPAPGWVVGGAIATGIAWGAGFAIGNAIWDGFDWGHGNIRVDINKTVNINKHVDRHDVKRGDWHHDSRHRRGVNYKNKDVRDKYAKGPARDGDRKLDYRGRGGEQVLKPGDRRPPDLGKGPGGEKGPGGNKGPDLGKGKGGAGKQAALEGKKPDLGKRPDQGRDQGRPKTKNAFDPSDGKKARDYSKRGQASLGNRSSRDFVKPKGPSGGPKAGKRSGGPKVGGGGGGGKARGGGRKGGGGRGGGRRR